MILQLDQWSHQSCWEIKIRNVWNEAWVIMVDMWGSLSTHVRRLPIETMWRRAKFLVLGTSPWRMFVHVWVWHPVALVMVRRSHL